MDQQYDKLVHTWKTHDQILQNIQLNVNVTKITFLLGLAVIALIPALLIEFLEVPYMYWWFFVLGNTRHEVPAMGLQTNLEIIAWYGGVYIGLLLQLGLMAGLLLAIRRRQKYWNDSLTYLVKLIFIVFTGIVVWLFLVEPFVLLIPHQGQQIWTIRFLTPIIPFFTVWSEFWLLTKNWITTKTDQYKKQELTRLAHQHGIPEDLLQRYATLEQQNH